MSGYVIGGVLVEEMDMSYSWGLSPAGASIKTVGECSLSPGDDATITLGGFTFNGICTSPVTNKNFGTGTKGEVKLADQRLLLMYDMVYASFNVVDLVEDNPLTPGIDRNRRYAHILPADWNTQKRTYTPLPLSAQTILDYCFDASTVHTTWTRIYHSRQSSLVHEIDANAGKKLGSVIQEITEAQALVFSLTDDHTLTWVLKGEGDLPSAPSGCTDLTSGTALTSNDTLITIVGDRNKHQVVLDLEPDWETPWEAFWDESDWWDEVNTRWGPFESSKSGHALLGSKAREVTVRDYVAITGDSSFVDMRRWGDGICRMEIPAWLYLEDIVWKAYRVPPDTTINGIDLFSVGDDGIVTSANVEVSSLLASVVGSTEGEITLKSPQELYPDGRAYVLVQGVNVELLDPSTQGMITQEQVDNMASLWTPCNEFTFDEKNLIIIFESATFIPGHMASGTGLYKFNNQGISGINNDNPLYNICVPNAEVEASPANVKACFCFGMERYASAEAGSGTRRGSHYVSGLEKHMIDITSPPTEITYLTGVTADAMAALYMSALVGQQPVYASGGYMRHGVAGTALSPVIDRVTVRLNFSQGLTERVDLTKERMPAVFMGERDLDRKQRTTDLFPHQRELRQEARKLLTTSKVSSHRTTENAYRTINDVLTTVIGARKSSIISFASSAAWPAGMPVLFDKATDLVSSSGTLFKGITVADGATGPKIPVATSGTVPVRVRSHFTITVSSSSVLSAMAASLAGCGGSSSSQSNSNSVDIALAINPGDMLYSIPSSGHNYATPFDLSSVFSSVVSALLSSISAAISGAFSVNCPSLPAVAITGGSFSVAAGATFPTLSITFPALSFGTIDPCKPLSSGADAVVTALTAYDFSSAFTSVNSLIDGFDPSFSANITLPNIDASALETALNNAIGSLLCSLASVVDDVLSNLDEIIKILEAIIVDYLTRVPIGVAAAAVSTSTTDVVLIPVALIASRGAESQFNSAITDSLFTIVKDIPLFGLAPARTVADVLNHIIPLVLNSIHGVVNAMSSDINSVASGLASGIQAALTASKVAVHQVVGLIQSEHVQVKALLLDYAEENKAIVDSAEQYMLKTAISNANFVVDYLKAPYIASPKIVLVPSPYPSLNPIDPATVTDFCELATAFTALAAQLADPAISDLSLKSYMDDKNLYLYDASSKVTVAANGTSPVKITDGDIDLGADPSITLDGSIGTDGDVITSDGSKASWKGILEVLNAVLGGDTGDMIVFTGYTWGILNVGNPGDVLMIDTDGYPGWTATSTCT